MIASSSTDSRCASPVGGCDLSVCLHIYSAHAVCHARVQLYAPGTMEGCSVYRRNRMVHTLKRGASLACNRFKPTDMNMICHTVMT